MSGSVSGEALPLRDSEAGVDIVRFMFYACPMSSETLSAKEEAALAAERHRMALRGAAVLLAFLQDLMAAVAGAILRSEGTVIGPAQRAALRLAIASLSPASEAIKALSDGLAARAPAAPDGAGMEAVERDPERAEPAVLSATPGCSEPASQRAGGAPHARVREGPTSFGQDDVLGETLSHVYFVPWSNQLRSVSHSPAASRRSATNSAYSRAFASSSGRRSR